MTRLDNYRHQGQACSRKDGRCCRARATFDFAAVIYRKLRGIGVLNLHFQRREAGVCARASPKKVIRQMPNVFIVVNPIFFLAMYHYPARAAKRMQLKCYKVLGKERFRNVSQFVLSTASRAVLGTTSPIL
jgi:hypothetical protein